VCLVYVLLGLYVRTDIFTFCTLKRPVTVSSESEINSSLNNPQILPTNSYCSRVCVTSITFEMGYNAF
jgi:hypothetical protein